MMAAYYIFIADNATLELRSGPRKDTRSDYTSLSFFQLIENRLSALSG